MPGGPETNDGQLLAAAAVGDEDAFVPVEHNLLVYQVDLAAPNATPSSVAWLGPGGQVVRRLSRP
jgi:hypothetical protein